MLKQIQLFLIIIILFVSCKQKYDVSGELTIRSELEIYKGHILSKSVYQEKTIGNRNNYTEYTDLIDNIYTYIDSVKLELLANINVSSDDVFLAKPQDLLDKEIVEFVLLDEKKLGNVLKNKFNLAKSIFEEKQSIRVNLAQDIYFALDVIDPPKTTWEENTFRNSTLITTLNYLELRQIYLIDLKLSLLELAKEDVD